MTASRTAGSESGRSPGPTSSGAHSPAFPRCQAMRGRGEDPDGRADALEAGELGPLLLGHRDELRVERVAARDLVREVRRRGRGHGVEDLGPPGPGHLRRYAVAVALRTSAGGVPVKQAAAQDRGEVGVVVDRRGLAVADQQVVELLPALLAGVVQVDVVVLRRDHHNDRGDVRDVVHAVEQRPQERHVLDREVGVLGQGELPDVVHDLVDQDQHRPADGGERLHDAVLVARSRRGSAGTGCCRRRTAATGTARAASGPGRRTPPRPCPRSCCRRPAPRRRAVQVRRRLLVEDLRGPSNAALPMSVCPRAAGARRGATGRSGRGTCRRPSPGRAATAPAPGCAFRRRRAGRRPSP